VTQTPVAVAPAPTAIAQQVPQGSAGIAGSQATVAGDNGPPRTSETRQTNPGVLLTQRFTRLPPTPEQIEEYSRAASSVKANGPIVPLPPVDPEHYPAGRY
jgi:hypothetical protein